MVFSFWKFGEIEMNSLKDNLDNISDDFQSTFKLVSENQLINMLHGEADFLEVSSIIKRYLGNVDVEFKKLNTMPDDYDAYLITISK